MPFVFIEKCPVYPTELVFALDQSSGVTERRFNETRDIVTSIVNDLNIREHDCPVGARVVVVSYDSDTSYLIRGSDYRNKRHLLQLLSQIKYQVPWKARDIGSAMRFVARNVFKRTSPGANARRVAVFFSNGQSDSRESLLTATMELSALDISLAVFAYNERIFLDEAFGVRVAQSWAGGSKGEGHLLTSLAVLNDSVAVADSLFDLVTCQALELALHVRAHIVTNH